MRVETFIGIAASILTATSLVPQLIKLLRERKSENVSILMLVVLFLGLCLWIYYGMLKKDLIIIISNSFALFINAIIVVLTIKFKDDH